ncbi:MAG: iron-containing redox enzyme family protein [Chromatiales bacterium]|jgi:pyrroloquinoline quinone (PQQ) biosynthesis protein C|nr:iron-containing redox enzyme family protein [Chromatiales bacterium]
MMFYDQLLARTADDRNALLSLPVIQECLHGKMAPEAYAAFLREAYHHVSHTVPLLHACRDHLPPRLAWLKAALDEYIAEEAGHDEWILNDLRALHQDADEVKRAGPGRCTEVMVSYAYDTIARHNPVGFFGMVHVLEGTSVALALHAADQIQRSLHLPDEAFSYLRSHGTLDQKHTAHFAELMNRLDDPSDQQAVVHRARMFYWLYGEIFQQLPRAQN